MREIDAFSKSTPGIGIISSIGVHISNSQYLLASLICMLVHVHLNRGEFSHSLVLTSICSYHSLSKFLLCFTRYAHHVSCLFPPEKYWQNIQYCTWVYKVYLLLMRLVNACVCNEKINCTDTFFKLNTAGGQLARSRETTNSWKTVDKNLSTQFVRKPTSAFVDFLPHQ